MQEVRRKKTLRKPVGVGKGRRHLSSTRRYVMGHAGWWWWCCGGGVVVVGCAWGPARRGFFGGGCTVVGSWGVWVFARLGAARRGGFWRLRIWWQMSPTFSNADWLAKCLLSSDFLHALKRIDIAINLQTLSHVCHNESNNQELACLFNSLFRLTSKKISKPVLLVFCEGNPLMTSGFPSQKASSI